MNKTVRICHKIFLKLRKSTKSEKISSQVAACPSTPTSSIPVHQRPSQPSIKVSKSDSYNLTSQKWSRVLLSLRSTLTMYLRHQMSLTYNLGCVFTHSITDKINWQNVWIGISNSLTCLLTDTPGKEAWTCIASIDLIGNGEGQHHRTNQTVSSKLIITTTT